MVGTTLNIAYQRYSTQAGPLVGTTLGRRGRGDRGQGPGRIAVSVIPRGSAAVGLPPARPRASTGCLRAAPPRGTRGTGSGLARCDTPATPGAIHTRWYSWPHRPTGRDTGLLPAACCLLPAACCLLPAACCLLPALALRWPTGPARPRGLPLRLASRLTQAQALGLCSGTLYQAQALSARSARGAGVGRQGAWVGRRRRRSSAGTSSLRACRCRGGGEGGRGGASTASMLPRVLLRVLHLVALRSPQREMWTRRVCRQAATKPAPPAARRTQHEPFSTAGWAG